MKVAVYTLGCKVNTYESEYVIKEFLKRGYTLTDFSDPNSDVYLINTCTVTNNSNQKSRKMIRQARAKNKEECKCMNFDLSKKCIKDQDQYTIKA